MRLVKKENHFRFFRIADFRQTLEQLRQQPEQERRVELRRVDQFVGDQNVDDPVPLMVRLHHVVEIERRLAEEPVAPLLFQGQQAALDRADASCRDIAVLGFKLGRIRAHVLQHGAQVFEIQQQHSVIVGDLENQVKDTALGLVQVKQSRHE